MSARTATSSVFISLIFCALQQLSVNAASSVFNDGLDDYQQHRYHALADSFEKAVAENHNDFKSHYYLGMCFEQLKEYDAASNEFEYAMRLNPFSTEGRAAKQGLMRVAGTVEASKHPADDPKLYKQALDLIRWTQTETRCATAGLQFTLPVLHHR